MPFWGWRIISGVGGVINLSQGARDVVFVGTLIAGGLDMPDPLVLT